MDTVTTDDHPAGVSDEQHVTWLELFFDLVFVAWLSLVNASLLESEAPSLLLGFDAALVAFTIWMIVSVINNRYPDGGLVRTFSMVLIMMLILVTALTVRPEDGLRNSVGAVMIAVVYFTCAAMLADIRARATHARLGLPIALCVIAGIICLAGAPTIGEETGELYGLGFVAVTATLFGAGALILLATDRVLPGHLLRPGHLDERWGQVVIITLGEGFLVLAEVLLGMSAIPNPWLFVLLFICVFAFWRLYFDSAMRVPVRESTGVFVALTIAHLLLIFGLITAFDFLVQGIGIELPVGDDYPLGGGSLALVFGALAVIAYTRRRVLSRVVVVNAVAAVCFALLGVFGAGLGVTAFVTVCVVAILTYAAVVRWVDPLARPLQGNRDRRPQLPRTLNNS